MTRRISPVKLGPTHQRLAPGHAVNPWRVLQNERQGDKIRVNQEQKLLANGRNAVLYQPVLGGSSGTTRCSCVDEPGDLADRHCVQCYGTGWAPGYLRFGSDTIWALTSQVSPGTEAWTLTGVAVDRSVRPWRLALTGSALTGTAVTTDRPFTATGGVTGAGAWEYQVESTLRDGGTVVTEYSTNAGVLWRPIADIVTTAPPSGSGNIRFRFTLTRGSANDDGPAVDGVRIRRVALNRANNQLLVYRDNYAAGQVLLMRTVANQQNLADAYMAHTTQHIGDRGWTSPLDYFDAGVLRGTPQARIADDRHGPHAFYEIEDDAWADTRRYAMVGVTYSTEVGGNMLTAQSWEDRLVTPSEGTALVW